MYNIYLQITKETPLVSWLSGEVKIWLNQGSLTLPTKRTGNFPAHFIFSNVKKHMNIEIFLWIISSPYFKHTEIIYNYKILNIF